MSVSYFPFICHVAYCHKISALSNLRISGCDVKENHYISFILLFKTNFYRYIGISVIFKPQHGFSIAGAGYTFYPV